MVKLHGQCNAPGEVIGATGVNDEFKLGLWLVGLRLGFWLGLRLRARFKGYRIARYLQRNVLDMLHGGSGIAASSRVEALPS